MLLPHKFNDFTQEYLQRFVSVENGAVEVQYTPAFTRCELDFESETVIRAEVYATRPYTETETAAITGNSCKLLNSDYYEMLQVPVQLVGETSGSYYEFASCLYDYPTDIAITRIQGTLTLSSTKNQTACLFAVAHAANPEVTTLSGMERIVMVCVYAIPGMAYFLMDLYFGNLMPAIIMHWVNNFLLFTLVSGEVAVVGTPTLLVINSPHNAYVILISSLLSKLPFVAYILWDIQKKKKAAAVR